MGETDLHAWRWALFERLPSACCLAGNDGRLAAINSRAAALLSSGRNTGDPPTIADCVHADDRATLLEALDLVRQQGEPQCIRCRSADAGEAPRLFEIEMADAGDGGHVILVVRERLPQFQDREQLENRMWDLHHSGDQMRQMAIAAAHDLKMPLVTIDANATFLGEDLSAGNLEKAREDLAEIRAAAVRMRELVSELLELGRIGRLDLASIARQGAGRPEPLEEIVQEAIRMVSGAAAFETARIEVKGPLPWVRGRRRQLVELFQNLLDNAIKFRAADREPAIVVSCEAGASGPVVVIEDNGVGIPESDRGRVFELFFQIHPQPSGSGIGLAIVRRIVATHGGRIWIEGSSHDSGTRFCIQLPVTEPPP
ncbi:MAG: HAMP domain-containing histidine kinase [Planctomyces sp.]|nr:HAMP domain-containing histidine kinase [Planctomyces sp.]